MNAEIVAVGSEMLTPDHVDTNSLYLTSELNKLGVEVVSKYVVGDHLDRLAAVVRIALSRSEIVILCGGLGPTEDDLTRDAVAAALDRPRMRQRCGLLGLGAAEGFGRRRQGAVLGGGCAERGRRPGDIRAK